MTEKTISGLLIVCAVIPALLGVATLLPVGSLVESDLGYKSWCPFAPWSTLIMFFFAWLAWALRQYLVPSSKADGPRRPNATGTHTGTSA